MLWESARIALSVPSKESEIIFIFPEVERESAEEEEGRREGA